MAEVRAEKKELTPAETILHRRVYTEEDTDRMFEQLMVGDLYFKTPEDKALVRKAYNLARNVYKGQKRHTGDSFIYHLFDVMSIVVQDIGLGAVGAAAGLHFRPITKKTTSQTFSTRKSRLLWIRS